MYKEYNENILVLKHIWLEKKYFFAVNIAKFCNSFNKQHISKSLLPGYKKRPCG